MLIHGCGFIFEGADAGGCGWQMSFLSAAGVEKMVTNQFFQLSVTISSDCMAILV